MPNREILYRGLTKSGEWVFGLPFKDYTDEWFISNGVDTTPVIADTIGQYTGVDDRDGTKIFEGDSYYIGGEGESAKYTVVWHDSGLIGKAVWSVGSYAGLSHWRDSIKVVGNIHQK